MSWLKPIAVEYATLPDGPVFVLRMWHTNMDDYKTAYWPSLPRREQGVDMSAAGVIATFPTRQLAREAIEKREEHQFTWA
jgi:hypothetical protein